MNVANLSKLVAVTLAMLAGFLLGRSSNHREPAPSQGVMEARVAPADPSDDAMISAGGASVSLTTSPKGSPLSETLKFEHFLATCDLDLFPAMLEKALSGSDDRWLRIVQIWIERDRDGCVAWFASRAANEPTDGNGHSFALRHNLVSQIARQALEAAWQIADQINADPHAKYSIIVGALKKDPAQALELARAHPGVMMGGGAFMPFERAGFDPKQALPVIEALHPGGGRNSLANDGLNHYAAHPEKLAGAGECVRAATCRCQTLRRPPDRTQNVQRRQRGRDRAETTRHLEAQIEQMIRCPRLR